MVTSSNHSVREHIQCEDATININHHHGKATFAYILGKQHPLNPTPPFTMCCWKPPQKHLIINRIHHGCDGETTDRFRERNSQIFILNK